MPPGGTASTSVAAASERSSAFWSSGEMNLKSFIRSVSVPSSLRRTRRVTLV
jgi:hypothetical protein